MIRTVGAWVTVMSALVLAACGGGDEMGTADFDAGTTADAAPPVDSGEPPFDAGVEPADTGIAEEDAGEVMNDAGGGELDAGMECPTGMAGPTCEDCAPGWQDQDGDGTCLLGCDATGADELDCGQGGACEVDADTGLRKCGCFDGYDGQLCDTCATGYEMAGGECTLDLPPTDQLDLWLDADDAASITLSGSVVSAWADRRPGSDNELVQTTNGSRPGLVMNGRAGRSVVRFDGVDDLLYTTGYWGLSTNDYEIIVAVQPLDGGAPNGILSATQGTSAWAVMLDRHVDTDYRLTHRTSPGATGGVSVVADRTGSLSPGWIAATYKSSEDVDTMAIFGSDGTTEATGIADATPGAGIGVATTLRLGRTQDGRMLGDVYEVLIYTRRLTVSERREVTDYLTAKWNLP